MNTYGYSFATPIVAYDPNGKITWIASFDYTEIGQKGGSFIVFIMHIYPPNCEPGKNPNKIRHIVSYGVGGTREVNLPSQEALTTVAEAAVKGSGKVLDRLLGSPLTYWEGMSNRGYFTGIRFKDMSYTGAEPQVPTSGHFGGFWKYYNEKMGFTYSESIDPLPLGMREMDGFAYEIVNP